MCSPAEIDLCSKIAKPAYKKGTGKKKWGGGGVERRGMRGRKMCQNTHPVKYCRYEMIPIHLLLHGGVSQEGKLLLIGHQITRN